MHCQLGEMRPLSPSRRRVLSSIVGIREFALLSLPLTLLAYKHFARHNDWPVKSLQYIVIEFLAVKYSIRVANNLPMATGK